MAQKKLESIEITPASNGGHTVRHRYQRTPVKTKGAFSGGIGMDYPQPEEHVFGANQDREMIAHVAKHLGVKAAGSAPPPEQAAGEEEE